VNKKILITVASWEERFKLGVNKLISQYKPTEIIVYYYFEYKDWSQSNRNYISKVSADLSVKYSEYELSFDGYIDTWKSLEKITGCISEGVDIIVDISTMPRDTIWSIFYILNKKINFFNYVYYKPKSYNKDWLSRDPSKPRLQLMQSGIFGLDKQTLLIIATGFDPERTEQLVNFYEPRKTLLGIQVGDQFENNLRNSDEHHSLEYADTNVTKFDIDAFSDDRGYAALEEKVNTYKNDYNILLASLGPKLTAVSLYEIWNKHQEVALIYAPSKEFNKEYSSGIGGCYEGKIG